MCWWVCIVSSLLGVAHGLRFEKKNGVLELKMMQLCLKWDWEVTFEPCRNWLWLNSCTQEQRRMMCIVCRLKLHAMNLEKRKQASLMRLAVHTELPLLLPWTMCSTTADWRLKWLLTTGPKEKDKEVLPHNTVGHWKLN